MKSPSLWERVIQRKEWAEEPRGGDWYMDETATDQDIMMVREDLGRLSHHIEWRKLAI